MSENKGFCSYPSFEDDFKKVLKQLEDESVFVIQENINKYLVHNMIWLHKTKAYDRIGGMSNLSRVEH